ncbi:MAG: iron ABC transporter permease [Gammaproteobacteria bacterium]|nr:iron ABC transporter permease [Gammaproteobacteria bacterium]
MKRSVSLWLAVGLFGYCLLPWYGLQEGFWNFNWLQHHSVVGEEAAVASGLLQSFVFDRSWLSVLLIPLLGPLLLLRYPEKAHPMYANILFVSGSVGLIYLLIQGFLLGGFGWEYAFLDQWFGMAESQPGMGYGALLTGAALLFYITHGLAAKGSMKGDVFTIGALGLIIALVGLFVVFPVINIFTEAFQDSETGSYAISLFISRFFSDQIWGVGCLVSDSRICGVAWTTAYLAILTGISTTVLGLAFALVITRSDLKIKKALRLLSILPIITPPFVVALAITLLLGRAGGATQFINGLFGIELGGWIYGLPGIWLSQTLAFTPIAFLVLIGVVEGVSPSMEEAAQTLHASRWQTFKTISLPLMRPGLANAFLIGFIESMADLGNPLVLGGDYQVLSAQIFYTIAGSVTDTGLAAALAIVLLMFTLTAFYLQNKWVGKKSYATVTGKGDTGIHCRLPKKISLLASGLVIPWSIFTIVIYSMIMYGGFVHAWGADNSFTLEHYIHTFGIAIRDGNISWEGGAWPSFIDTILLASIAAPLTTLVGLLIGYLISRQNFIGKSIFEFGTMLSFAIPGLVIGVSYVLAFNQPPFDLTFTGTIIVMCFVFRNMPVGVRACIAGMSQLDKNMDEAALTLGARSFTCLHTIILPLLRPAIIAAMVYGFVRSVTSISAVIFLVSAEYNLATTYIFGLVENAELGSAIAYSSTLIVVMLGAVLFVQLLVGKRKLYRATTNPDAEQQQAAS